MDQRYQPRIRVMETVINDIETPMALDVYIGVAKRTIASTEPKVRVDFMKFRMHFLLNLINFF